jgi:hypothetical protein
LSGSDEHEALGFEALLCRPVPHRLGRLTLRWRTAPLERLPLTPVDVCGLLTFLLVTADTGRGRRDAAHRANGPRPGGSAGFSPRRHR